MWAALLGVLAPLLPKLITYIQELWGKYGKEWLIYRKGAADQRRKDQIAQQDREAKQASRAQERVSEIQEKARDSRGQPPDGSDLFGRVRPRDWHGGGPKS